MSPQKPKENIRNHDEPQKIKKAKEMKQWFLELPRLCRQLRNYIKELFVLCLARGCCSFFDPLQKLAANCNAYKAAHRVPGKKLCFNPNHVQIASDKGESVSKCLFHIILIIYFKIEKIQRFLVLIRSSGPWLPGVPNSSYSDRSSADPVDTINSKHLIVRDKLPEN